MSRLVSLLLLWLSLAVAPGLAAAEYKAGLLRSGLPNDEPAFAHALTVQLTSVGYQVTEFGRDTLWDAARLTPAMFDLLVIPDAGTAPRASMPAIAQYLRGGGDVIALDAPLWQSEMISVEGEWMTRDEYERAFAGSLPEHVLFDFAADSIKNWQRSRGPGTKEATYETVADGPASGQRALHVVIPQFAAWDTFGSPPREGLIPKDHVFTVFSAKGGPDTTQLSIEWDEKDGSRWVAVVPLTSQWRRYVLTPDDFHFWQSVPNRGKAGDRFRPENAVRVFVGLSQSHTGHSAGRHEYWVGPFGTAPITPVYEQLATTESPPQLDTLWPSFKLFDCTGVASLNTRKDQLFVAAAKFAAPQVIRSPHPRPRAVGIDKERQWRWIPLVEARTADEQWRGTPATLMVHVDGEFKGGIWASFGIGDAQWYRQPAVLNLIGEVARTIRRGLFIIEGGADKFTYFDAQVPKVGVRVASIGRSETGQVSARITLTDPKANRQIQTQEWTLDKLTAAADGISEQSVSAEWPVPQWPVGGLVCTVELLTSGQVIDRVSHEIHVWRPKQDKRFVTVKDGEFMLQGQRWRAHGINYMPSSGIASNDWPYFERWLGARSYDPEVMDRDLSHLKDIGYNAVSIFLNHPDIKAQNLVDLLRRLDRLHMKANVSLRPGTPMNFPWPQIREHIERLRLAENDTVFAYDLAWEPMFGHHEQRREWDSRWGQWVIERYGSIANAEKDWGFAIPRDTAGSVTNPSAQQIDQDGEWRRMVAAYRRFLDTLLYEKYSRARTLVRSIDPNHLVSFRMAEAGNPTLRWNGLVPYDFAYLVAAVDILAPEGYGRIGDWEKVRAGCFTHAYARWADPTKPLIWAEMGNTVWDLALMATPPQRLQFQAGFYFDFYKMLIGSGADGMFSWWYPGGFRCGENSDFGIINPDGSDRPVTKVIRERGPQLLNGPSARPVDHWITIDRDARAEGLTGIYETVQEEFWTAITAGKTPGLRTAGTGTDSANCPPLAVGNRPWNGTNPPKYLDAAFDRVEVQNASGKWVEVERSGRIEVARGKPVLARVRLTNLGEAKWVAPAGSGKTGAVFIIVGSPESSRVPIPNDVPRFASVEVKDIQLTPVGLTQERQVLIALLAEDRTPFGEKFAVTLVPQ